MLFESNRPEFDRAWSLLFRIMDLEDNNILVKYEVIHNRGRLTRLRYEEWRNSSELKTSPYRAWLSPQLSRTLWNLIQSSERVRDAGKTPGPGGGDQVGCSLFLKNHLFFMDINPRPSFTDRRWKILDLRVFYMRKRSLRSQVLGGKILLFI